MVHKAFSHKQKAEAFVIFCCHPQGSYSLQAGFNRVGLGKPEKNHVSGSFEPETSGKNACFSLSIG